MQILHLTAGDLLLQTVPVKNSFLLYPNTIKTSAEFKLLKEEIVRKSQGKRKISRFLRRSEPLLMDHTLFAKLQEHADSNTFAKPVNAPEHNGILMRSKGEKLIAEHLDKLGYLYVYETSLILPRIGKKINPDFTVYIPEIDKVIFIEYMGAFGKEDYLFDAGEKFKNYGRSGIVNGRDVIFVCESQDTACDMAILDAMMTGIIMANTEPDTTAR